MTGPVLVIATGNTTESLARLPVLAEQFRRREAMVLLPHESATIVSSGHPDRTLTLPKVLPFQMVIRHTGQDSAPAGGGRLHNRGGTLVVRSADGTRLATLKRGQAVTVTLDDKPRRKLRRIGGSDRLWRALRGGR